MYNKIPTEIKPTEASTKITYGNAFEYHFSLILRERRFATLFHMQASAIEVEANMLAFETLKTRSCHGE